MNIHQRSNESLRRFLTRFRDAISKIPDLVKQLGVNYHASRIDGKRHATFLENFLKKNPWTLYAIFQIVKYRMTLQEAMRSI